MGITVPVVLCVAGVVTLLLAILGEVRIKEIDVVLAGRMRICSGVVGAALIGCAVWLFLVPPLPPTPPTPIEIKITYPHNGGNAEVKETVRGTSQNIPKEQAIWIAIYPHEVGRYYPQDLPADVQANGDWSSFVHIGTEADVGKEFDIIAVLANKEAQDAFNDYLGECKEKKSWPGFKRLPEGAVEYYRITVIRK